MYGKQATVLIKPGNAWIPEYAPDPIKVLAFVGYAPETPEIVPPVATPAVRQIGGLPNNSIDISAAVPVIHRPITT